MYMYMYMYNVLLNGILIDESMTGPWIHEFEKCPGNCLQRRPGQCADAFLRRVSLGPKRFMWGIRRQMRRILFLR